jgi:maltooligosyltrehalose trehalohydrolase
VAPRAFVTYLDNHDQVANTGSGERLYRLTSPGRFRAATALLLLGPGTPLLFQGQEWGAPEPFRFFADHGGELGAAVFSGRRDFMAQFPSSAAPEMGEALADPGDEATFRACRLGRPAGGAHAELRALHRDLLALRREDPVLSLQGERGLDGAVLGAEALCLRFFAGDGGDRLLLVNLGRDLPLVPAPEPLLAPPEGRAWRRLLSTEDPRYGGRGTPPVEDEGGWRLPGHAAVLFGAERI